MRSHARLGIGAAPAAAAALVMLAAVPAAWAARPGIDERRAADPHGEVEIVNVGGRVEVAGWDRAEVEVAGTLSSQADKLDISTDGAHTSIRVVPAQGEERSWGVREHGPHDADLLVHVPQGSHLTASLVSADIAVRDLQGEQDLQTVSGEVTTTAAGAVRIHTVSGDVHLSAGAESALLEIGTVSGDIDVNGGHGDVTVSTVSGQGKLALGTLTHARFKSVSGDYELSAALAGDGVLEAQSVSGDFSIDFTGGVPPADFDLHSFSGSLKTCFGQNAVHERYGPGSRLSYREGAASARVRIDTSSGDVKLCARHV